MRVMMMNIKFNKNYVFLNLFLLLLFVNNVQCVPESECFGSGSIIGAVFGTLIVTIALICGIYFLWHYYWKSRKGKHLVLETDVENPEDQYAFDNPCFKDSGIPAEKLSNKVDFNKTKWTHWSPLGAFSPHKHDKKKTLDDSLTEAKLINCVTLRSHDFTGLGFNIQGNMRDGIFIKDILHRGPAFESGKVSTGDRIVSVRISFDHMVYEDALTILSYASPYQVELELESSVKTPNKGTPVYSISSVTHPMYKSGSSGDLTKIGKSIRQNLFQIKSEDADYPTLRIGSQPTTLERPKTVQTNILSNTLSKPERTKKAKSFSPSQLKEQLELSFHQSKLNENLQKSYANDINDDGKSNIEIENENSEPTKTRLQKFGIRVLPQSESDSSKSAEKSQNENNTNFEKHTADSVTPSKDEVDTVMNEQNLTTDNTSKHTEEMKTSTEKDPFKRQSSITGSGIKRDKLGIPQEIPDHMLQAANAARKNRKSSEIIESPVNETINDISGKSNKKSKGKAPAPPSIKEIIANEIQNSSGNDLSTSISSESSLNSTVNVEVTVVEKQNIDVPEDNKNEVEPVEEMPQEMNAEEKEMKSTNKDHLIKLAGTIEAAIKSTVTEDLAISDHIVSGGCNFEYSSDSDADTDQNSVINNTIELNASDITIHHSSPNSESDATDISNDSRKAASLGDLSKFEKSSRSNTGTLERAQSLDITDTGIPTLSKKRKAPNRPEDEIDIDNFNSDEILYSNSLLKNKEPRLSLGIETLTFQPRLKKWGNLENVIANISSESNNSIDSSNKSDFDKETTIQDNSTAIHVVDTNESVINDSLTSSHSSDDVPTNSNPSNISISQFPSSTGSSEISSDIGNSLKFSIKSSPEPPEKIENNETVDLSKMLKISANNMDNLTKSSHQEPFSTFSMNPIDETKDKLEFCLKNTSESLILNEKFIENPKLTEKLSLNFTNKLYDTNVSDDIKVSRHSLGSLERPKSDVLKNVNKLKQLQSLIQSDLGGVSNVTVNTDEKKNELLLPSSSTIETELNSSVSFVKSPNTEQDDSEITNGSIIDVQPDFKNITHFQIITSSDDPEFTASELYTTAIDTSLEPTINNSISIDNSVTEDAKLEVMLGKNSGRNSGEFTDINVTSPELTNTNVISTMSNEVYSNNNNKYPQVNLKSTTFVTEIEVSSNKNNISEVTVNNGVSDIVDKISEDSKKSFKKLPEMKFSTSSYENSRPPEKRLSQIEMLRSNFENKNTSVKLPTSPSKSKIPVAMSKTSPDRPTVVLKSDIDSSDEKEIIDIMSKTTVHSTPITHKTSVKSPVVKNLNNKNITVTSIRTSSKIPSGHHNAGNYPSRPPIPPRRNDDNASESMFQQWVFTPTDTKYSNIIEKKKD